MKSKRPKLSHEKTPLQSLLCQYLLDDLVPLVVGYVGFVESHLTRSFSITTPTKKSVPFLDIGTCGDNKWVVSTWERRFILTVDSETGQVQNEIKGHEFNGLWCSDSLIYLRSGLDNCLSIIHSDGQESMTARPRDFSPPGISRVDVDQDELFAILTDSWCLVLDAKTLQTRRRFDLHKHLCNCNRSINCGVQWMHLTRDALWILSLPKGELLCLSRRDGKVLRRWPPLEGDPLCKTFQVVNEEVFVLDENEHSLTVYNESGEQLRSWHLSHPCQLLSDGSRLFVTDFNFVIHEFCV